MKQNKKMLGPTKNSPKIFRAMWTVSLIAYSIFLAPYSFADTGRDTEEEYAIQNRLEAVAPKAVGYFEDATRAMDAGDNKKAEDNYRKVLEAAPGFVPALRRLSYVIDDKKEALRLAQRAYGLEDHPYNIRAVMQAWDSMETEQGRKEAAILAERLMAKDSNSAESMAFVCQTALRADEIDLFKGALEKLRRLAPDEMATHYFSGIEAAIDEHWIRAEQEIENARALGLPEEVARGLLEESGIAGKARHRRMLIYAGYGTVVWVIGLVALLLIGMLLSRTTLAAVEKRRGEIQMNQGGMGFIRRAYTTVLGLTSIYFYISIPVVIMLVLAAGGGLIYFFFALGRIPVKLVAIIAIVVCVTVFAILKSLFVRVREEDPGLRLMESDAPSFFSALREVSSRIGAPMVDTVFVVPDATLAVFERGSFWKRLRKQSEKCLILGLGALNGMTQLQLKSILAHEFGHISNRDTAGGSMALHVRRSIGASAEAMAEGGAADWYNPGWLFIQAFYRIFLRVSQGASRLQEVLADQWAVMAYGSRTFIDGLQHVIRRSIEYDVISRVEVQNAIRERRQLSNFYALNIPERWPASDSGEEENPESSETDTRGEMGETPTRLIEDAWNEALQEATSPYDSHPAPGQRIAWASEIRNAPDLEDDRSPAWDLLDNAQELQTRFVDEINERVQGYIEVN